MGGDNLNSLNIKSVLLETSGRHMFGHDVKMNNGMNGKESSWTALGNFLETNETLLL
ncbi:unnamed protein product [Sphenostylis stenocarpa]|uniref:Uncharacterized protein n=1 Tax=Sphenostylis stenocarpa TaxID=92480 RepID=A0AA86S7M4_9FABA|nr:unnamed protein product [Sphenostylis stenocarpa]